MKSSAQVGLAFDGPLKPLLKWPGGKRLLLKHLTPLLPTDSDTYYEPFLGGGALFFSTRPQRAILSDLNHELIELYTEVRDNVDRVAARLFGWKNSADEFYRIRSSEPRTAHGRAARLIYLTGLSFNGIHRVNQQGQFNVPYGYKAGHRPLEPEHLIAVSKALSGASLLCDDFEVSTSHAGKGDTVYFDPPYTVAHSTNGFVKYNSKIFSWADQVRLADVAETLRLRGCHVVVSNADHASIAELYPNFHALLIERHSVMAATAAYRKKITECIFHSGK